MSKATPPPRDPADPAGPALASSTRRSKSSQEMERLLEREIPLTEETMAMLEAVIREHYKQGQPERDLSGLLDGLTRVKEQKINSWVALRALQDKPPSRSGGSTRRQPKRIHPRSRGQPSLVQQGVGSHRGHELNPNLASAENVKALDPGVDVLKATSSVTLERLKQLQILIRNILAFEREQEQEFGMAEQERAHTQRYRQNMEDLLKRTEGLASTLEDPVVSQTEETTGRLEQVTLRVDFIYGMFCLEAAKLSSYISDDWKFPTEGDIKPEIASFHRGIEICISAVKVLKEIEEETKPHTKASNSNGSFDSDKFILESDVLHATRMKHGKAAKVTDVMEFMISSRDPAVWGTFKGLPKGLLKKPAAEKVLKSDGSGGHTGTESKSKASALKALDTLIVNMSEFVKAAGHGNPPFDVGSTAMVPPQPKEETATTYFNVAVPTNLPANIKLALEDLVFVKQELKADKDELIDLLEQIRTVLEIALDMSEDRWGLCKESLRLHPCALEYEHKRQGLLALMICCRNAECKLHKFAYAGGSGMPGLPQELLKALKFLPSQGSKTPEQIWDEQNDRFKRLARSVDDLIDAYDKLRAKNYEQTLGAALEQFGDWWTPLLNIKT